MPPRADIVIVNWNSGPWLSRCLESVAAHGKDHVGRVIVVDNGSEDGSESACQPPVELIRTKTNLGFGRACNLGAARASSAFLLFLNPDAALTKDTLEKALPFMQGSEAADIGVCGVQLRDEDGRLQKHCARFPSAATFVGAAVGLSNMMPRLFSSLFMDDFDHLHSRPVDHVIGAFYLVRREVFESVGGFDERYFVYLEDLDLSLRIYEAGWSVHYLAEACAFHKGGGTSENVKAHRLFYSRRSRLLYSFKHFGVLKALAVLLATLCIEPVALLARAALRRSAQEVKDTALGMFWLWKDVPAIIRASSRAGTAIARPSASPTAASTPAELQRSDES